MAQWRNRLVCADNLAATRALPAGSVDLCYLDPPFQSASRYEVLLRRPGSRRGAASVTAFDDVWRWGPAAEEAWAQALEAAPPALRDLLAGLRGFLGESDLLAYLAMMAPRLLALRHALSPTGSLYLHCDPSASHYLKLLLDGVFGPGRFRREIVWRGGWVSGFKAAVRNWVRNHDTILYYTASEQVRFEIEETYVPHPEGYARRGGGGNPRGVRLDDVWTDIHSPMIMSFSREKLGYPTQKPEALLDRIVRASSRPGELVLDPFCGSGTTMAVAERLGRRWIGVDSSWLAVGVAGRRLAGASFDVEGGPRDVEAARALAAASPRQFQWWALQAAGCAPDGEVGTGRDRTLVRVEEGVGAAEVAELRAAVEREGAAGGVILALEAPSAEARAAAAVADRPCSGPPRLQILTVAELLAGARPDYPDPAGAPAAPEGGRVGTSRRRPEAPPRPAAGKPAPSASVPRPRGLFDAD